MSRYRRQKPASTASSALRLLAVAAGLSACALLWAAIRPTVVDLLARANLGNSRAVRLLERAVADRYPELGEASRDPERGPSVRTFFGRSCGVLWSATNRASPARGPSWIVFDERLCRIGELKAILHYANPGEDRNADGNPEMIGAWLADDFSAGYAVVRVEPARNTLLAVVLLTGGPGYAPGALMWTDRDTDGLHELEWLGPDQPGGGARPSYHTVLTLRWMPDGSLVCTDEPPPGVQIWAPPSSQPITFTGSEPLHEVVQRALSGR